MTTIEQFFDKIFVINRDARTDRWAHCLGQFKKFTLTKCERFSAHDGVILDGRLNGNAGCTASHRALLEIISYHKWPRTLILEDDFKIRHDDFHQKFNDMIGEVPEDWDMLYLGGHYAEKPQGRVSAHVIRIGRMLTTSSYAVAWQMARHMAADICGVGPIDSLYGKFHLSHKCYIFQPRLMVQAAGVSDLTGSVNEHPEFCMEDPTHENMV
jgi:hypothetical protein